MTRKTILLDMDSIIVAIDKKWYSTYNRIYGDDLCTEKVTEWNIAKFCKNLPQVNGKHPIYALAEEPGFFRDMEPLPGAIDGAKRLVDAGHRVVILSAPFNAQSLLDKQLWLDEHMPFVGYKNVMFSHQKDIVHADVVFDDGPHNITAFRNAQPNIRIATIAYPYNYGVNGLCDFVAGSYLHTQTAWYRFVKWVEVGAPSRKEMDNHYPLREFESALTCLVPW